MFFVTDLRAPGHKMVLVAIPFMDIFCTVIFSFLQESIVFFKVFGKAHDIRERMQIIMRGKTIHDHGFGGSFVSSESFMKLRNFLVFVSPPVHTFKVF